MRTLANQYNFVLIFDEIQTCGKFHGGIRDFVNVEPDLITLGKAIGGGVPIAGIAGKRKIMETVVPGVVSHAGTFNSNPLCIAVGIATLSQALTKEAMTRSAELSKMLAKGYEDAIKDNHLTAQISQAKLSGAIAFSAEPVTDWRSFQACDTGKWFAYCLSMMNRGIIPGGHRLTSNGPYPWFTRGKISKSTWRHSRKSLSTLRNTRNQPKLVEAI